MTYNLLFLPEVEDFIRLLQEKLDEHLETPPVTKTIEKPF
jgi:hypothetical protein